MSKSKTTMPSVSPRENTFLFFAKLGSKGIFGKTLTQGLTAASNVVQTIKPTSADMHSNASKNNSLCGARNSAKLHKLRKYTNNDPTRRPMCKACNLSRSMNAPKLQSLASTRMKAIRMRKHDVNAFRPYLNLRVGLNSRPSVITMTGIPEN